MVGCWGVRTRALEKKVAEAGRVRLGEVCAAHVAGFTKHYLGHYRTIVMRISCVSMITFGISLSLISCDPITARSPFVDSRREPTPPS